MWSVPSSDNDRSTSRRMFSREHPPAIFSSPPSAPTLLVITTSSRRDFSTRPRISSELPWASSASVRNWYLLAQSMKLMPESMACSIKRTASLSEDWPRNPRPRAIRDTSRSLEPILTNSISLSLHGSTLGRPPLCPVARLRPEMAAPTVLATSARRRHLVTTTRSGPQRSTTSRPCPDAPV